jgi:CHAD domain-containing protein
VSFAFRPGESVGHAVRRLARKSIDKALEQLTEGPGPRTEAIHEARKRFKKVRAVLRLVRDDLGRKAFKRENRCFRDAGRPLSEVRDAQVLVGVVEALQEHFPGEAPAEAFAAVREALRVRQKAVAKRVLDEENAVAAVAATARGARERVAAWADVPDRWGAIRRGLRRVYRQGYDAFSEASAEPRVENLHEWRKRTKDLWHLLRVLGPLWPAALEAQAAEAHRLGDLLGDGHDLFVLHELLTEEPPLGVAPDSVQAVCALIERRRHELQESAVALGRRLYAQRPRAFVRSLEAWWHAWRSEASPGGKGDADSAAGEPAPDVTAGAAGKG